MQQDISRVAFLAIFHMAVDRSVLLTDYFRREGIDWFGAYGANFLLPRCNHEGLQVGGV